MSSTPSKTKPTYVTLFRWLLGVSLALVVILAGDELAPHLPQAEEWIVNQGWLAPVYYILLMSMLTLVCVPLDLLLIAAGMMFPLGSGYLYVVVGLYTSQSLIFWVSRLLVHRRVQRWIERRPKMNAISRAIEHDGIKLLLLLRLAPIPASPISYLMGASRMKFWRFCVANLGLLPVAFVSQYVGYAAIHATRATAPKHSTLTIQDLSLYGGLAVAIIIVGFIGHIAHKALKEIEANA